MIEKEFKHAHYASFATKIIQKIIFLWCKAFSIRTL